MDAQARQSLARFLRTQRIAAPGTVRDTAPPVSMALYVAAADFSAFCIHLNRLAQHTQTLRSAPRAIRALSRVPRNRPRSIPSPGITRPAGYVREPAVREWSIDRHSGRRPGGREGTR
jgi:hypothetical protein